MRELNPAQTCKNHRDDDLRGALDLLGRAYLIPAAELSWQLGNCAEFAVGSSGRDRALAAMLMYERALVEFFLRPKLLRSGETEVHPGTRNEICPWCFVPRWRLENCDVQLAQTLKDRWRTISAHKAHLSWKEVERPRNWSDWKIFNVLKAFDHFLTALDATKPDLADFMRSLVSEADLAYEEGPR